MTEEQVRAIWNMLSELDCGELMYQDLYDAIEEIVGVKPSAETTICAK